MKKKILLLFSITLSSILFITSVSQAQDSSSTTPQFACSLPENLQIANISSKQSEMGKTVSLTLGTGSNDAEGLNDVLSNNRFTLFLNNYALDGVYGKRIGANQLEFDLERTDESQDAWTKVLGGMLGETSNINVSMGCPNQAPIQSPHSFALKKLNTPRFGLFCVIAFLIAATFVWLGIDALRDWDAWRIDPRIRDQLRQEISKTPFSLGKTQMALWFFVITFSFGGILAVTGDYTKIITSQSMVLMGISAATGAGSMFINDAKMQRKETAELITSVNTAALMNPKSIDILLPRSKGFFRDLLTDRQGVSFHRYQIAVWTVVLATIFIYEVIVNLKFPEFDATLLTLQGISSGTYLGFKFPEPEKGKDTSTLISMTTNKGTTGSSPEYTQALANKSIIPSANNSLPCGMRNNHATDTSILCGRRDTTTSSSQ